MWHVDDLLVSHKDSFEITKLAVYLEDIYRGLSIKRGKVHDYLGMTLDFSKRGELVSINDTVPEQYLLGLPGRIGRHSHIAGG